MNPDRTTLWLGTHQPDWLERINVPLMVSHRRLKRRKNPPRALGPWVLDSGGFSELSLYGRWDTTPRAYAQAVKVYVAEVGQLQWAAPQDWMCEPDILKRTGLSVSEHQIRTLTSFLVLRDLAPEVPWIPVLQGWTKADYLRCVERYERIGVDLWAEPVVGIGSVCRRQATGEIADIVATIGGLGIRLHGFGVKMNGMKYATSLASIDSMAWSFNARKNPPLPGHSHKSCANCIDWALAWRERVLTMLND